MTIISRCITSGLLLGLVVSCSEPEASMAAPTPSADSVKAEPGVEQAAPAAPAVEAPSGGRVFFVQPTDGSEVKGPLVDGKVQVKVIMGVEGAAVHEAGQQLPGTGHHHLIVDGQHIPLGAVVPKDETHLHYGKGQTETELQLAPGEHSITMQFADGAHLSYGPQMSTGIKVKVVAEPAATKP